MPRDRTGERLIRCLVGLVLCGAGIVAIIGADLGLAPWDVLHQGISDRTGLPIGTVIVLVGVVVLTSWWPLGIRPGPGTVLNAVLIGVFVDVIDPAYPDLHGLGPQVASLAGGIVAIGVGTGLYIGSGLGAGPRDGLMTGIAATRRLAPHDPHAARVDGARRRMAARRQRRHRHRRLRRRRSARSSTSRSPA